jgi:D-glycero-alpha-D-manno-heptose-7-phosphate kinase
MIITQTPLRISFFGGGTDFRNYYRLEEGCVLTSAIDKYIFVLVKERFDGKIRLGYTRTELVDRVEDIQHELIREALRLTHVSGKLEIDSIGDIPSTGSGLGSSSTVTVGVLNALHQFHNSPASHEDLAQQACEIEISRLGKPIGKQDQYIAAYGGLRFIRFRTDDTVIVESIELEPGETRRLNQQLMLFYTNTARSSESVLHEQNTNINRHISVLRELKGMAFEGRKLLDKGDFDGFGRLLHEGWQYKKKLASKISNSHIDEVYDAARKAGALGGKITGAGGGGFMLLYCPREKQYQVRDALRQFQELPFHLENDGSKVIFNYRR